MKVHAYPDGTLAVLHGPRVIGRYTGDGVLVEENERMVTAAPSVTPRSIPSRQGLAASPSVETSVRRPTLTGPRRGAAELPCRKTKRCAA